MKNAKLGKTGIGVSHSSFEVWVIGPCSWGRTGRQAIAGCRNADELDRLSIHITGTKLDSMR